MSRGAASSAAVAPAALAAVGTLLLLLLASTAASAAPMAGRLEDLSVTGTVYLDTVASSPAGVPAFTFVAGKMDIVNGVAVVNYSDWVAHSATSGFGELSVRTSNKYNDTTQMAAAGYAEGVATAQRIYEHSVNVHSWVQDQLGLNASQPMPVKFVNWFQEQEAFWRDNSASNSSDLWTTAGFLLKQFDGVQAGYNAAAAKSGGKLPQLDVMAFHQVNAIGDLLDLLSALEPSARPDWDSMDDTTMVRELTARGHCSGMIRVTGNYSELFAAHVSWFTYESMTRIFKHYWFDLATPSANGRRTSFSSYPGILSSLDDFYQNLESQLVMVQTSNGIMDHNLYKKVTPQSLLAWQRVRMANDMATSGQEWCDILASYNSGTYTNQYMVTDYKLFTPGQALPNGLLTVCEQIPGLVVTGDKTATLEAGYFPSYNVPVWDEIYNKSGYPTFIEKYGATHPQAVQGLGYQLAPRAQIFRRDAGAVHDIPSLQAFMRENKYPNDPYWKGTQQNSPFNAICSRGDLIGAGGGCYDGKVTSYEWMQQQKSMAVNGPTTDGGRLAPFTWSTWNESSSYSHLGQPDTFAFEWETMMPDWARQ